MKRKRLCNILLCLLLSVAAYAHKDSTDVAFERIAIYQGTQIKLDIASPALTALASKGKVQHYEIGANVRLKDRFYPTLELGWAGGTGTKGDSITYKGNGGFFRVGVDINPLKKHPESPHALLIGVRLGTAVQGLRQGLNTAELPYSTQADCWGEIVAGCQVQIISGFYMGWMARMKFLFTRQEEGAPAAEMKTIYIPGFGDRANMNWGVNYYLGWKF